MPDLPANTTTTATLSVGGTYSDSLETSGDRDWVRVDLAPGEYVTIRMEGQTLDDPYMRIYDSNSTLVIQNDDGNGYDSSVTIGSETGGTFYVEAGSYNDTGTGTYELTAEITTPVDTLISGNERTDTAVSVYFVPNGVSRDGITSEGWTATERAQFMAALATIEAVANITFTESSDPNADFQVVLDDNELLASDGAGLLGYFYFPSGSGTSVGVFNGSGYGWDTNGLQEGGLGFSTIVHEALHGLGLAHPHDGQTILAGLDQTVAGASGYPFGEYGDFDLNQAVYTIMSYNAGLNTAQSGSNNFGDAAGPMALDIAALQEMYGANTSYNNGTNTYIIPDTNTGGDDTAWVSIWDTGGIDTMIYSGSDDVVIDLRQATLEYEVGGGGYISAADGIAGGYTIANGVIIENATGGSGNDTLTGNSADNVLIGNGGNDDLIGAGGVDNLTGGAGNDTVTGGTGDDNIDGGTNNDTLYGDSGSDDVQTSGGINTIYGGSGFDDLDGGSGVDTIFGGSGDDNISGGGSGDTLYGGRGDDDINGDGGADTIVGGMGADTLTGGAGDDTFVFNAMSDSFIGNADTIDDFGNGTDKIDLSALDISDLDVSLSTSGGDTTVLIDSNGDGTDDMAILLTGTTSIDVANDFIF
jgi:hypothetical protein